MPVRPWVLSFPFEWRLELARSAALLGAMIRTFAREVERFQLRNTSAQRGDGRARFGAVTVEQRFGGPLNLHVHLHVLVLDGVYERRADGAIRWVASAVPTAEQLAAMTERVAVRAGATRARRA
ncbi:MAG: transposase, partial [Deltaproteobacteria bacterium]|nr:transposase [Nannocystaceae bacterium]